MLAVGREEARHLADQSGLSPYDALIDRFEPGMRGATIDRIFGEVKQWLPGLIARITAQAGERDRRWRRRARSTAPRSARCASR